MTSSVSSLLPLNLIPLQHAVLCANCDVLSESRNGHCVVCGSPSLISLARVLGPMDAGCVKGFRRSVASACQTQQEDFVACAVGKTA